MKKKIISALFICVITLAFLLALLLVIPPLIGWQNMVVMSDSMEPTLKQGDMICIDSCEMSDIMEGDIVTFMDRYGTYTTHRVVRIEDGFLITKGDANIDYDAYKVDSEHLVGKVKYHIPLLGRMILFFQK